MRYVSIKHTPCACRGLVSSVRPKKRSYAFLLNRKKKIRNIFCDRFLTFTFHFNRTKFSVFKKYQQQQKSHKKSTFFTIFLSLSTQNYHLFKFQFINNSRDLHLFFFCCLQEITLNNRKRVRDEEKDSATHFTVEFLRNDMFVTHFFLLLLLLCVVSFGFFLRSSSKGKKRMMQRDRAMNIKSKRMRRNEKKI